MSAPEFADNSEILFGREQDLAYLQKRAAQSGITAVVARPQMGKSWLLTELARRLSLRGAHDESPLQTLALSKPMQFLVGFYSSEGSTSDQMLRAVVDLYTRWLAVSNYRQQAEVIWKQHKHDLVGKAGEAVGTIIKELSKLASKRFEVIGGLVSDTLRAFVNANRDLVSGGIQLPSLQGEQACELVTLLHKISSASIVLVLDQWEKSSNLDMESNILDSFLRHLQNWPPCHIFLGVRDEPKVHSILGNLKVGFSGEMEIYQLPLMRLDEFSGPALVRHIRSQVIVASTVSDQELLRMIAGYPGTVSKWTKSYNAAHINTTADLQAKANEAQRDHYDEFNTLIPQLTDEERLLAMRLALTPACANKNAWDALRPAVLGGSKASLLDRLKQKNMLERALPPTYGHATRSEFAWHWFKENYPVEVGDVCETLVSSVAGRIRDLNSPDSAFYCSALMNISGMASEVSLSRVTEALLIAASSLFPDQQVNSEKLLGISAELRGEIAVASLLIAMGLVNTMLAAKKEQDLKRRDALLGELRTLAESHGEDAAVREWLVAGLFIALLDAKKEQNLERHEALLHELRALAENHPDNAAVREVLATGLFNTLNDATEEQDLKRRDALL